MNRVHRGKSREFDGIQKVASVAFTIIGDHCRGLGIGKTGNALLRAEVELDPYALIRRVDHRECMTAETVHVAKAFWNATIGHHDRHLVQCLGQKGPEIPVAVGAAQAATWVPLYCVVEVREAQRIAKEEHRRVVPDDVPVSFLCVELYREATYVTLCVRGAALAGDRREAREHRRLLADRAEDLRACIARDVVCHGKRAMGTPTFSVHPPLGDHLAIEMRQLLDQPDILQQRGPARRGHDISVVGNRSAGCVGKDLR